MLIDRQIIRHDPEGWAIVPNAALPEQTVPDTLQGLILARFDRLDERDRRTLQIASVIGHEFNIQLLYNVLENEPGLSDAVEQLHQRDFIFQKDGAGLPSLTYAFKHVLTSETVYGTLLKRDRDVLHGKVAETIERLYSARLDEYVEMLAHHFGRSGDAEKALHYLIASGEKAYRVLAIPEARGYFEQARDLLVRVPYLPDQKYAILSSLGDILTHSGEYEQALPHLREAESLAERAQVIDQQANALGLQAQCWSRLDRWDEVLATEQKWRDLERRYSRERVGETCFFVALSARVHALRGDRDRAEAYAKESYDWMVSMSGTPEKWQRNQYY